MDTSLFEAGIVHTYWQSAICLATGVSPGAIGSAHPLSAPYQAYKCSDGYMVLGAPNQMNWARLCNAIGATELIEKKEFIDLPSRRRNNEQLTSALEAVLGKQTVGPLDRQARGGRRALRLRQFYRRGVHASPHHRARNGGRYRRCRSPAPSRPSAARSSCPGPTRRWLVSRRIWASTRARCCSRAAWTRRK